MRKRNKSFKFDELGLYFLSQLGNEKIPSEVGKKKQLLCSICSIKSSHHSKC